jgi:hypothetical protein
MVSAVKKVEPSMGTVPWTNWSADCSSSIITVAVEEEKDEEKDEEEEEEEEEEDEEDEEVDVDEGEADVVVLDLSARSFDEELEHKNAPTVIASEATDAVLPSLTKIALLAAVKGAPRGVVALLSMKA